MKPENILIKVSGTSWTKQLLKYSLPCRNASPHSCAHYRCSKTPLSWETLDPAGVCTPSLHTQSISPPAGTGRLSACSQTDTTAWRWMFGAPAAFSLRSSGTPLHGSPHLNGGNINGILGALGCSCHINLVSSVSIFFFVCHLYGIIQIQILILLKGYFTNLHSSLYK